MAGEPDGGFKRRSGARRDHGETIADRQVSNLELFYDLVYVAVIGQAAHHLAEHVTVRGLAEFAVVFALIWIAWINGSLYLELHGREDGRTRSIVFAQMGILVLLAVFTEHAADTSGRSFALVYAVFLVVNGALVHRLAPGPATTPSTRRPRGLCGRHGRLGGGDPGQRRLPATLRLIVWAGFAAAWIVGIVLAARSSRVGLGLTHRLAGRALRGCSPSSSSARSCSGSWPACRRPNVMPRP